MSKSYPHSYNTAVAQAIEQIRQGNLLFKSNEILDLFGKAGQSYRGIFNQTQGQFNAVNQLLQPVELQTISKFASLLREALEANQKVFANLSSESRLFNLTATQLFQIETLMGGVRSAVTNEQLTRSIALLDKTRDLSSMALSAWRDFAADPVVKNQRSLPLLLLKAPLIQAYEANRNTVQIIAAEETEDELSLEASTLTYGDEANTLVERLATVDKGFAVAFLGAKEGLLGKPRDYVRHVCSSLRELMEHLISRLVPDELIEGCKEVEDLLKQRQYRKARLKYLYRNLSTDSYVLFADKDIDHILQTFYALNDGVHTLESPFSGEIMDVLMARVEGQLLLLLTVAQL